MKLESETLMIKTKDYSIFKIIDCNRDIDESGVKSLSKSIMKKNLLKSNPIIVDSHMQVMDGQHRLRAAETLGVDIYYIIDDNFSISDISRINSTRKNWSSENYINFYMQQGFDEYIKLDEFLKEFKISLRCAIVFISGRDSFRLFPSIKDGSFNFKLFEESKKALKSYCKMQNILISINFKPKMILTSLGFIKACKVFFESKLVDHDLFFTQLDRAVHLIHPCGNGREYLDILCDIYNFRMRTGTIRTTGNKRGYDVSV